MRPAKDMLVARLNGVGDRNAAERLTNMRLYVPRERLPPADDDEFYHADLVGLAARDARTARAFGTVMAVHNFGAGDLLEIEPAAGGNTLHAAVHRGDGAGGRYRGRHDRASIRRPRLVRRRSATDRA